MSQKNPNLSDDSKSLVAAFKVEAPDLKKEIKTETPPIKVDSKIETKVETPVVETPSFKDPIAGEAPVTEAKTETEPDKSKPVLSDSAEGLKEALEKESDVRDKKTPEQKSQEREGSVSWLKTKWTEEQNKVAALEKEKAEWAEKSKNLAELDTLKEKVAKLEPFEQLYTLDHSPEFIEKYTKPLTVVSESLVQYGEAYGLTESQLNGLLTIDNEVERIKQLSKFFKGDAVVVNKVERLLQDFVQINSDMEAARKKPVETLQALIGDRTKTEVLDTQTISQEVDKISSASFDYVYNGYKSLPQTALYFNKVPGDDKQNQVVESLNVQAKGIYGRIVGDLKNSGIRKLDAQTSNTIAAVALKASRFDALVQSFMDQQRDLEALKESLDEYRDINRPGMRTSSFSSNGNSSLSTDELLKKALDKHARAN